MSGDWHARVSQPGYRLKAEKNVFVTMRDGVRIAVDVYRPDASEKLPALLGLSPYGKDVQKLPIFKFPTDRELGNTRRSPVAPDTPTISESGVPGFQSSGFFAIFAPAGTPRDVVSMLHRALVNAVRQRDVEQRLVEQAYEIVGGSPEQLAEEVAREIGKWQRLVRERNLKFD